MLWERGLLDPLNLNQYIMDGQKDHFGIHQLTYSLKHILSQCKDFQEEESLLQTMAWKMGVTVDCTTKCHCESVGEGIEYSWGCAKNIIVAKRGKKRKHANSPLKKASAVKKI
jgi:hypothetical protein